MEFNDILRGQGIAPRDVSLMLHKPGILGVRRALAKMVDDEPAHFMAYQSTHPKIQEGTVRSRPIAASFVMRDPGELVFVGLYDVCGYAPRSAEELRSDPVFRRMHGLVHENVPQAEREDDWRNLDGRLRFDMRKRDELSGIERRLVVQDPGARNYARHADTTRMTVLELTRLAGIVPEMPAWDCLTLTRSESANIPKAWAIRLADWRGIYLIVDRSDGARYVGAAYGEENLLGRWRAHVARDAGVTAELRHRDTDDFRFTILELLHHDATEKDVIARERRWMDRLDTIESGLNR